MGTSSSLVRYDSSSSHLTNLRSTAHTCILQLLFDTQLRGGFILGYCKGGLLEPKALTCQWIPLELQVQVDFRCTPITYGPPNHSWVLFRLTRCFPPTMWEHTRGLPSGEMPACLLHMFNVFAFGKKVVVFAGPLILGMLVTELHINLDQLKDKATP
jgi:hypothetical protein